MRWKANLAFVSWIAAHWSILFPASSSFDALTTNVKLNLYLIFQKKKLINARNGGASALVTVISLSKSYSFSLLDFKTSPSISKYTMGILAFFWTVALKFTGIMHTCFNYMQLPSPSICITVVSLKGTQNFLN